MKISSGMYSEEFIGLFGFQVANQVTLETLLVASQGRVSATLFPAFEGDFCFVLIHAK
jgi:hypothetical protein